MITPDQVTQLADLTGEAKTIIILLTTEATLDQVVSALGLYSSWRSQGKDVTILSPEPLKTDLSGITGAEVIRHELGNKDLQISFPYKAEQVDKVSYNISDDQTYFHLVIKPQPGVRPLDSEQVSLSYSGAEADLLITVGVSELEALGHLYEGFEDLYQTTSLITLHNFETSFGNIKLDTSGNSCLSEATAQLLFSLNAEVASEVATNLLFAIELQTDSFKSLGTTAETFEVVSKLMRAGARRTRRTTSAPSSSGQSGPATKTSNNLFVQAMAKKSPVPMIQEAEVADEVDAPVATPKPKRKTKTDDTKTEPKPGDLDFQPSQLK